ncbi:MAG: sigma-70 region 4 domain-containing protein [Sandaracinaceae bacterium]|nr:sigma-70 region 4 domain-containing protein [Sandaracinaceae bacterium]
MPETQFRVLVLHAQQVSWTEIAGSEGVTVNTARSRLRLARKNAPTPEAPINEQASESGGDR